MDNSPLEHGLSLTLSWGASASHRRHSLPLGMPLRVGLALLLCAVCYEAGRWYGSLEAQAEKFSGRAAASARTAKTLPAAEPRTGASGLAPGQAVGEPVDVITPLNVRDPSALVMGPGANEMPRVSPAAPPTADPESEDPKASPPARVFPRPSGKVKPDRRF